MVREVVQELHLHKVEIWFVDKMLWKFSLDQHFIFINSKALCSRRKLVLSVLTLPFLLFVQSNLRFHRFCNLHCTFTGAESTENIHLTMRVLEMILHVLNCGFCMVPVPFHKVKVPLVLDAQQGFWEGNTLACWQVEKSCHENSNNHVPEGFHLLATPLGHLAIWLVESSEAWISRYHCPEMVEFVDPGMLVPEGHYPVHHML